VDLNQLYFDHQLLLMKADRAPSAMLRRGHEIAAWQVAGRIGQAQRTLGAPGASAWEALAARPGWPAPGECRIEGSAS